jgi:hypothetical protein
MWKKLTTVLDVLTSSIGDELIMEDASFPETSVYVYEAIWHNVSVNSHLHASRRENLKYNQVRKRSHVQGNK